MDMPHATWPSQRSLSPSQVAARRRAASKMTRPPRCAFAAEMTVKYCGGTPLMAAVVLGWGRQTVALGLAERRTGIRCLGAQSACSGRKRWAARPPQVADALRQLAEAQAHQDPRFRTSVTSTRLTAQAALQALRAQGASAEPWPSPSTMAEVVHRMGFRWRKVVKATPQKKSKETDAIVDQRKKRGASRVSRPRQTLEDGWSSDREHRRMFTRWSHPGRPPSP